MSDLRFSFPACIVAGKGMITPDDLGHLREHLWPEGLTSRQHVATAIALDSLCSTKCPEWTRYLIDSVSDFVVWRQDVPGIVPGTTAGWLLEGLADDGAIRSDAGLDILLRILDIAHGVPAFLSAIALNQLRLSLLNEPRGAYARRRESGAAVTRSDLAYVWRVLRGSVERGALRLSPGEKFVMQSIDRMAPARSHHAGWRELMVLADVDKPHRGFDARDLLSFLSEKMKGVDRAA